MADISVSDFYGLTSAELLSLRADILAAIHSILVLAQSYSIAGRSYNKASLSELRKMLSAVNFAVALQTQPAGGFVYADLSA